MKILYVIVWFLVSSNMVSAADACLIVLENKQFGIYDKSCQENHHAPEKVFDALCDMPRKQDFVIVKDLLSCPQDYFAYCESRIVSATGSFRTYTYTSDSVASLKQSCFANVGGIERVKWVQVKATEYKQR